MISTTASSVSYVTTLDAVTFSYPFKIQSGSDLRAFVENPITHIRTEVPGSSIASITGVGSETGGLITFTAPFAEGSKLFIVRGSPSTQVWDGSVINFIDPNALERVFDKITLLTQEVNTLSQSAFRFEIGEAGPIATRAARAGKTPQFDTDGNLTWEINEGSSATLAQIAAAQAQASAGIATVAAESAADDAESAESDRQLAQGYADSAFNYAQQAQNAAVAPWITLTGTTPEIGFIPGARNYILTVTGNTTFTSVGNDQSGKTVDLFIYNPGEVSRTLSFPAYTWLEGIPTEIFPGQRIWVSLRSTADGNESTFACYASSLL